MAEIPSTLLPASEPVPAIAQRLLAALARAVPVPGWYVLVVQPLLLWLQRTGRVPSVVVVRRFGAWIELDLEDYVQRKIFCHSHQPRELRFLARACRPGDVVVDVGANVGIFTLVAAQATAPTGAVHAFEPIPATFARLQRNARRNGLAGVHANQLAVSDRAGTIELGVAGPVEDSGGFSRHGRHNTVTVPAVRLDDELEARRIRLLKLDVEGDEWRALDGLERTLGTSPPDVLLVEFSEDALQAEGASGARLADRLRALGYELFTINALGRLKAFDPLPPLEASKTLDSSREHVTGPLARLRRLWSQHKILAEVVAVRPGVER